LRLQIGTAFDLDGRRALVAYRRYLYTLLWVRMLRREDVGEMGGPLAVRYVDNELNSVEDVLRKDAPAFLAGAEEVCVVSCRVLLCPVVVLPYPVVSCCAVSCRVCGLYPNVSAMSRVVVLAVFICRLLSVRAIIASLSPCSHAL
jgi:hypothetical protein